jgi:hypothetical protein
MLTGGTTCTSMDSWPTTKRLRSRCAEPDRFTRHSTADATRIGRPDPVCCRRNDSRESRSCCDGLAGGVGTPRRGRRRLCAGVGEPAGHQHEDPGIGGWSGWCCTTWCSRRCAWRWGSRADGSFPVSSGRQSRWPYSAAWYWCSWPSRCTASPACGRTT